MPMIFVLPKFGAFTPTCDTFGNDNFTTACPSVWNNLSLLLTSYDRTLASKSTKFGKNKDHWHELWPEVNLWYHPIFLLFTL